MTPIVEEQPAARHRAAERREEVERLLELAAFLPARDRALMEQVFRLGTSVKELGRLAGQPAWHVRKRVRGLLHRVRHPLFTFTATHMHLVPCRSRPAVRLVVFHGLSLRDAARRRRLPLHVVRHQIQALRDLASL